MKECENPLKGLECKYGNDDDAVMYCSKIKCEFKKISYKDLMQEDKTVNGGRPL